MQGHFLYVFGESSRDRFLEHGLHLLKEDCEKGIYVFVCENGVIPAVDGDGETYFLSDTLTF